MESPSETNMNVVLILNNNRNRLTNKAAQDSKGNI